MRHHAAATIPTISAPTQSYGPASAPTSAFGTRPPNHQWPNTIEYYHRSQPYNGGPYIQSLPSTFFSPHQHKSHSSTHTCPPPTITHTSPIAPILRTYSYPSRPLPTTAYCPLPINQPYYHPQAADYAHNPPTQPLTPTPHTTQTTPLTTMEYSPCYRPLPWISPLPPTTP